MKRNTAPHNKLWGILFCAFQCAVLIIILTDISFALPQRIISTMPSITETLFALGLGDKVVGVTTLCNYPSEAKNKEKIGGMTVNLEKVVSLKPDLIIMLQDAQPQDVWRLQSRGFNVLAINPHNVPETIGSILEIGKKTGAVFRANAVASNIKFAEILAERRMKGKPAKSVFVMVGYKPLVSCGRGTFVDDVLVKAGASNAIENKVSYPQINFEELYRLNPEIMIIPKDILSEEELKSDQKLSRLPAVQNGKILWMDPDVLFRPGPRIAEAITEISEFIAK